MRSKQKTLLSTQEDAGEKRVFFTDEIDAK